MIQATPPNAAANYRFDRDLVYASIGARALHLDLYWFPHTDRPMPLIIWIHGGAWQQGSKDQPTAQILLEKSYAVASIEYRLSPEAIFPAQIHDCKAAVRWLRANGARYNLDPNRFGAWGPSAGGHLVALLGTSGEVEELEGALGVNGVSSRVQAVCDWYGPTDFLQMNEVPGSIDHNAPDSPESQLVGAPIQDCPDLVAAANPITYVTEEAPPFLIMHGARDLTVLKNQSERLHGALQQSKVLSELILIEDAGHGFEGSKAPPEQQLKHVEAFFDRELRPIDREGAKRGKPPDP